MALDKFTQITKSGIVTTINFECHHLYSTGIATFSSGNISAVDGTFTGDVSIGGTLTYQDVTNIDSVGLVTARLGLNVTAGVSTFAALIDANGGVDISGGSGLVASTAKISDLTDNRVVIGGSSGELEDSANLTFDGSNLGVGSKVTVTNANADSRNVNSLGADINAAWIRIGDKAAAKTFTNGLGIKFYDQGTAHWSTGTIGNQYYVSYTGSAGDELFPSSRVDALTFNTTGAAVFASDITAGGNLYIPDKIYHTGDTDTFLEFGTDTITLETAGSERLRITSAGAVGINATNPNAKFQVEGASAYVLTNSGRAAEGIDVNATAGGTGNYGSGISFGAGATGRAAIVSLQGASDADNVGLAVITHPVGTGSADGVEKLRITSGGLLLLGTTDTGFSTGYTTMTIGNTSTQNTGLTIASSSSNGYSRLHFADGTSGAARYAGWIAYSHGDDAIVMSTNNSGSEKLRLTSGGNLGINEVSPDNKLHITTTDDTDYDTNTSNTQNITNALLKLQNLSGTDNSGVNNYVGIQFAVANGATSSAQLNYVRTGNNAGAFQFKARNASSTYPNLMTITSGGQTRMNPAPADGGSSLLDQQALIGTKHIYTAYHNFSSTNSDFDVDDKIKTNSCGELWVIGGWANGNGLRMKKYTWVASGSTSIVEQSNTFASRYGVGITLNTPTMSISGDYVNFNFTFSDNQGNKMEKLKIHFEYFQQFRVDG